MRLLQKYGEILELDEKRGYACSTYPQEKCIMLMEGTTVPLLSYYVWSWYCFLR